MDKDEVCHKNREVSQSWWLLQMLLGQRPDEFNLRKLCGLAKNSLGATGALPGSVWSYVLERKEKTSMITLLPVTRYLARVASKNRAAAVQYLMIS